MNKQTGRVYKPSSVWKAPVVTSNMPVNKPVLTSDKVKLLTRQNVQFPGANQTSTKTKYILTQTGQRTGKIFFPPKT